MPNKMILWDIDHTLIDTRGVGRELSAEAFEQATGMPMTEQARIDGITERVIFRETGRLHGLTTDGADFHRFAEALTAAHVARAAELRERGHALPGAASALDVLAGLPGVRQTVVTGNVRGVAEIKLQTFGLDRHIEWDLGAYGEDADERADVVRMALRRASQRLGHDVSPAAALLLGDTPADVQAALEVGVPVIAVASGRSSEEELREAGATWVLPDLTDAALIVKALSA